MKRKRLVTRIGFLGLVLLLAIGLVGCDDICPTPTPTPPPPPVTDPEDEAEVEAGGQLPIRASAAGAEGYRWELLGSGSLSTEGPADITIYTAPEEVPEGGAMVQLNVTAYNSGGESPPTSLIINIVGQGTVFLSLNTVAISAGWMSGDEENVESYIQMGPSPIPCEKTGVECLQVEYTTGGDWGGIYWWPLDCGESGTPEAWDRVRQGNCGINLLEVQSLAAVSHLTFWARGEQGGEVIEFKVGGHDIKPSPVRSTGKVTLSTDWELKKIDLTGVDLSNAAGLFCWVATDVDNPEGAAFYLNDIRFEGVR